MESIRIGNDINIEWSILRNGDPETLEGKDLRVVMTNGYAKKMLLGEDGDIVATEIGGSSSTYWCDYYYTYTSANRMQVVLVGGLADNGSLAGLARVRTYTAPSDARCGVGSRLCFFPEFRKTSA